MGPIVLAAFESEVEKIAEDRKGRYPHTSLWKGFGQLAGNMSRGAGKVGKVIAEGKPAREMVEGYHSTSTDSAAATTAHKRAVAKAEYRRDNAHGPFKEQVKAEAEKELAAAKEKKASARGPGLEKIAAIWGCALPSPSYCGPGSTKRWSDRFVDTPFIKKALALEKTEADKQVGYAQEGVASAERQMKEAQFRVKVATLESKLLSWKAEQGGEKAKVAMQEKLAMCTPCCMPNMGSWEWSDHFKLSPFYREAVKLDAEDAHMNVERTERGIEESKRWRGEDENRVAQSKVEAEYADWRVSNL